MMHSSPSSFEDENLGAAPPSGLDVADPSGLEVGDLSGLDVAAFSGLDVDDLSGLEVAVLSGLEVEALGGAPGTLSHRFAGKNADDAKRNEFLLNKLKAAPDKNHNAQFRCVIAIAEPAGRVEICSGKCHGVIIDKPRGANGFGYDPIFLIPELEKTMAELTLTQKNKISHRARAAEKARALLVEW